MICPKCQSRNDEGAKFCGACAQRLEPSGRELKSRPVEGLHRDREAEEDAFVGKVINNKYYIKKRIAAGGMGVVYLATQKGVGQDVAIKKLHSTLYRNREIVERFINEARSYGRITHPNAVKLYDLLNVNGELCIIMEFVHGRTLTQYVEEKFIFSQRQIVSICLQLADALDTVHRAGIIHRDLKTENVMLLETSPGRFSVKILDFGIAKMMDTPPDRATEEGLIFGTPEFMSPEQCYGVGVDARSDIYAFGILMYVMIACHLPFTATSKVALMHKQVGDPPPPLKRPDNSELNASLVAMVYKCMEKKPEDRYQSFGDVIIDLTDIQEGNETRFEKERATTSTSDVSRRVRSRDSGFSLGLDLEDDDRDPSMPFMVGFDDSGEYEKGDMAFDTEFDDRGFTLGSSDGYDAADEDFEDFEAYRKSSVLPKVVAVLLLLMLLAGAAVFIYGHPDYEPYVALKGQVIEFFNREAPPVELPVVVEPVEILRSSATSSELLDVEKLGNVPDFDPDAVAEPAAVVELAAAPDISRIVFERGIARASLAKASELSLAADISEANDLLKGVEKQKDVLSQDDVLRFEAVKTQNLAFEKVLATADRARRDGRCGIISQSLRELPDDAKGVSERLKTLSRRCNAYLAAPPTTL